MRAILAVAVLTLTATLLTADGGNGTATTATLTVVPKKSATQNGAPAGQVIVYAEGTYGLLQGQTFNKVVVSWYKQDASMNLTYVGQWTDNVGGAGKYKTNEAGVDINDANNAKQKYTGIAVLYVNGANAQAPPVQAATAAFTSFTP